jgi:hypothetical protein
MSDDDLTQAALVAWLVVCAGLIGFTAGYVLRGVL